MNKEVSVPMPGRLIVLEGSEGTGKTVLTETVAEFIRESGREVVVTRAPGGSPLADKIRALLLDKETGKNMHPETELHLFIASHRQNFFETIKPALDAGKWVVSDRLYSSAIAYQNYGRQLGAGVTDILARSLGDIQIDLEIFVKSDPEIRKARMLQRGGADRIELEGDEFFQRVDVGYDYARSGDSWSSEQVMMINNGTLEDAKTSVRNIMQCYFQNNLLGPI